MNTTCTKNLIALKYAHSTQHIYEQSVMKYNFRNTTVNKLNSAPAAGQVFPCEFRIQHAQGIT